MRSKTEEATLRLTRVDAYAGLWISCSRSCFASSNRDICHHAISRFMRARAHLHMQLQISVQLVSLVVVCEML